MAELQLTAELQIRAAGGGKVPSVRIVAYSGGLMRPQGFGDCVVNCQGVEFPDRIPLLADHRSDLDHTVGSGKASSDGRTIVVEGTLTAASDAGAMILAMHKDGVSLQASIGLKPTRTRTLKHAQTIQINGRSIACPAGTTVVEAGTLVEVSLLSVPADQQTSVAIAARKGNSMNEVTENTNDTILAAREAAALEQERIASITQICGSAHATIAATAIRNGWDASQTELEVLRAERDEQPVQASAGPAIHRAASKTPTTQRQFECSLLLRAGFAGLVEQQYGVRDAETADRYRRMSLVDMMRATLRNDSQPVSDDTNELIRCGLSYLPITQTLSNALGKTLAAGYEMAPSSWRKLASVRSAADFKDQTAIRPSLLGDLRKVYPGGELFHDEMSEAYTTWSIGTYGRMLSVDRRDVINDDLSAFEQVAPAMGAAASRAIDDLVWTVIVANAGSHFSGANAITDALDSTGLSAAIAKLRVMKDAAGSYLNLQPRYLVCSPTEEPTALALVNSTTVSRVSTSDLAPEGNAWSGAAEVVVEPRIATPKWYLWSDPSNAALIVGFLQGKQTPTLEFFDLQTDPSRLAVSWRVYHDYGAVLHDKASAIYSTGAT